MRHALTSADPSWVLREDGFDTMRESGVESRFAVSNGFLGVRASRAASRGPTWACYAGGFAWTSWPRTYVAGLFDMPNAEPAVPALVPAADWLRVRILLDGEPLLMRTGTLLSHGRTLDMRRGLLISEWRHRSPSGVGVTLRSLRLASQADRALGLQLIRLELDRGDVDVCLEASFEAAGVGLDTVSLGPDLGVWRTLESGKGLAMAGASGLRIGGEDIAAVQAAPLTWSWEWRSSPGETVEFNRLAAVARGDGGRADGGRSDPGGDARGAIARASRIGWRGVLGAHEAAWAERWRCSDITVDGDPAAQQALRFAAYHLNSAANPDDGLVSVGARALTGDSYLGHVFWDTEIYLLPFYTFTWPEAARALLMYRHHTLAGARAKAAKAGWAGAMYAWESADTGEEATPERVRGPDGKPIEILCGTQEQHITADVAYAVWQYWKATGDDGFMAAAGAEILMDTARFWASRAQPEADGLHHIRGIIGPDEYHEHVDDNAFTNIMAAWNIFRGLDAAAWLKGHLPERWTELAGQMGISDSGLAQWRQVADTMATGLDPVTGLFEQFSGYHGLKEIDLTEYSGRTVPMDVVLGREAVQASQVIKQADVVALLALLPDAFGRRTAEVNFRHYEPRCGHGSSLSPAMHGLVAARLGDGGMALKHFRHTAALDLEDNNGGTAGGVRIAALGGLWQVAMLGFAGLSLRSDGLAFDPQLPSGWESLGFRVQWRGRQIRVSIEGCGGAFEASLERGDAMTLAVRGEAHRLRHGQVLRVPGK